MEDDCRRVSTLTRRFGGFHCAEELWSGSMKFVVTILALVASSGDALAKPLSTITSLEQCRFRRLTQAASPCLLSIGLQGPDEPHLFLD
jgi:hypothetical protein